MTIYNLAITARSKSSIIYGNCALAHQNLKQYRQAIADYSQAIFCDPNYADAYYSRALVYLLLDER